MILRADEITSNMVTLVNMPSLAKRQTSKGARFSPIAFS